MKDESHINAPVSFIYSNLLSVDKGEFMNGASEAAQSTIFSPHVRGVETETLLILSKISEEKELLKIKLYEDYLSALSCEQNIKDLKKTAGQSFK